MGSRKGTKSKGSKKRVIELRNKAPTTRKSRTSSKKDSPVSSPDLESDVSSDTSVVSDSSPASSVDSFPTSSESESTRKTAAGRNGTIRKRGPPPITTTTTTTVAPERKSVLFCDPPVQDVSGKVLSGTTLKPILKSSNHTTKSANNLSSMESLDTSKDKDSILSDIYSGSFDIRRHADIDSIFKVARDVLLDGNDQDSAHLNLYIALNMVLHNKDGGQVSTDLVVSSANDILTVALHDLETARNSKNKLDLRDIVQIVRLVDYMFFASEIANILKHELVTKIFYIGVSALENHQTPKSIVGAYLHMFNYQHLPKPMPDSVAVRLLTCIGSRPTMSSAALLTCYITCLRVLVQSHPNLMTTHCTEWIPLAMRCLINSNSAVRQESLTLMQECTKTLLPNYTISNNIRLIFNEVVEWNQVSLTTVIDYDNGPSSALAITDDHQTDTVVEDSTTTTSSAISSQNDKDTYINLFCQRMSDLLNIPNDKVGASAMNTWSTIVICLAQWSPQSSDTISKWEHFSQFLNIAKGAFNSVSIANKLAAIQAWRTLIGIWFSAKAPAQSMEQMQKKLRLLLHPLISLIPDKRPAIIKHVSSTYVYLVNNALRCMVLEFDITAPGNHNYSTVDTIEYLWTTAITPALVDYFNHSALFARDKGIDLLSQLLSVSPVSKTAAVSPSKNDDHQTTETLIALPSRFIRLKLKLVLSFIFQEVYQKLSWSAHAKVWFALTANIKSSMKREIHISSDTMNQIASICNYISLMVNHGISLSNLLAFVSTLFNRIGTVFFLERELLSVGGSLIASPQNRKRMLLNSGEDVPHLPISYIWKGISSISEKSSQDQDVDSLLEDFFDSITNKINSHKRLLDIITYFVSETVDSENLVCGHMPKIIKSTVRTQLQMAPVQFEKIAELLVISLNRGVFNGAFNVWIQLVRFYADKSKDISPVIHCMVEHKTNVNISSNIFIHLLDGKLDKTQSTGICSLLAHVLDDLASLELLDEWFSHVSDYLTRETVHLETKAQIAKVLRTNLSCYINGGNFEIVSCIKKIFPLIFDPLTSDMMGDKRLFFLSCVDIISEGLVCQDSGMVSATIKVWNSQICSDKSVMFGPYPEKLVDSVTTAKVNRRRIKIPRDLEVHSFRSSSRSNKASISVVTPGPKTTSSEARDSSRSRVVGGSDNRSPITPTSLANDDDTQLVTPAAQIISSNDSTQVANSILPKRLSMSTTRDVGAMDTPMDDDDPPSSPPMSADQDQVHSSVSDLIISGMASKGSPLPVLRINKQKRKISVSIGDTTIGANLKKRRLTDSQITTGSDTQPVNLEPAHTDNVSQTIEPAMNVLSNNGNVSDTVTTPKRGSRRNDDPSTPPRESLNVERAPLTPDFSSPPKGCLTTGKALMNMLRGIEADLNGPEVFSDLTPAEKFEAESLLMKALYKTRFSQSN